VEVKGKLREFVMKAPPGPALVQAESLEDTDIAPRHLDRLPDWADAKPTGRQKKLREVAAHFHRLAAEKSVGEAIDTLLKSDDPAERQAAVYLMGATDDLKRLGEALTGAQHPDVWDAGVLALRHWIGRGPGQDQKLYRALTEKAGMPAAQAETVLHLLHGLSAEDLQHPVAYQVLIRLLGSDRLGVRGLAYWHLSRLVPDGRNLGYNPLDPPEKREAAIKRWKELIPPGKMPPKARPRER
jgi:hypothetical protein